MNSTNARPSVRSTYSGIFSSTASSYFAGIGRRVGHLAEQVQLDLLAEVERAAELQRVGVVQAEPLLEVAESRPRRRRDSVALVRMTVGTLS